MKRRWLFLDSGPGEAAFNMAVDEALLESMPRLGSAVLRCYCWTQPAASFGYFQKYAEVERLTPLRPVVRRPTAGGIVPHDADWTYSLAFPVSDPWYALSARESYRAVHEWLRSAFEQMGVPAQVAPEARKDRPGQCFAGYEQFDLVCRDRKIAGAAQRRTRSGLLIQGSVQPPQKSLSRSDWQSKMREVAISRFNVEWTAMAPDQMLLAEVQRLSHAKYSRPDYNQKR